MASSSFTPVPECCDAKLLQVLVRQARQNRLVYLVLAEYRLVLSEAQAPQPDHNVHGDANTMGGGTIMVPQQAGVQASERVRAMASTALSNGVNASTDQRMLPQSAVAIVSMT